VKWTATFLNCRMDNSETEEFEAEGFPQAAHWIFTRKWKRNHPYDWKCLALVVNDEKAEIKVEEPADKKIPSV